MTDVKDDKIKKHIKDAVCAFFTTWALQRIFSVGPGNIMILILFILLVSLYSGLKECTDRRGVVCSYITAGIFSALYTAYDLADMTGDLKSGVFRAFIGTAAAAGLFILFQKLLGALYGYIEDKSSGRLFFGDSQVFVSSQLFGIVFIACFLCMVPCFLYEYPGIMTPDSINQLKQVIGVSPFSNHHPFVHTMLIALFYKPAYAITHSMTAAVGCYTLAQMCMMALTAAYCTDTLNRLYARKWVMIAAAAFYAAVPYNWVYAVSVWKDVLFAAAVLIYGASLLRIFYLQEKKAYVLQFAGCLGMALLRSNGWFMFLGMLPFMAVWFRSDKKQRYAGRLLTVWLLAFIVAVIVRYPLFAALKVAQPDLIESCSIPAQQIAYVFVTEKDIPEEDRRLVNRVADTEYINKLYAPGYADNIKELVRAGDEGYLTEHKGQFLALWVRLGLKYPGDYLKAYGDMTYGYWFPDRSYTAADNEGISENELGLTRHSLISAGIFLKLQEIQIKLGNMVPLYSALWCMGTIVWICAAGLGGMIVQKRFRDIMAVLPGFIGILTVLIATPVAYDFRYLYFLIYSFPLYLTVFSGSPEVHRS
jgi:hypothetical protein